MIIDYIGQELIWNLRGNNPYCLNLRHYHIVIKCINPKQNAEAAQFILSHIEPKYIVDIIKEKNFWHTKEENIIKKICIENVFEEISSITFYNDFMDYSIDKLYEELGENNNERLDREQK